MFCPNCGANIPGDSWVCPECGTEIVAAQSPGSNDQESFIVAEDACEVHTPFGPVVQVEGGGEETHRSAIIEAEEEKTERGGDILLGASLDDTDAHIWQERTSESERDDVQKDRTIDIHGSSSEDGLRMGIEWDSDPYIRDPVPDEASVAGSVSGVQGRNEASGGTKTKLNVSEKHSYIDLPPPSRRRSVIVGLGVIVFVVMGLSLLVYGLPWGGPDDTGVSVPTPLPTVLPDVTPVPVTETPPPWTPSKDLSLSIMAYDGGYKVEIDGGLKKNEVAVIEVTVKDDGGLHTMEWTYPSRHESFFMAREAYNGTASAIEHVTATATFTDGKKEVVFSGDL